ncbi:hypothetical protein CHS0354_003119 [Potamilus streckersoni]|uniref:Uncharacterized protein n=1 Tax=Potamilus streckersoni TaxID=2493646 RepID=A0AAE0VHG8_9BIVA|nr:hypothetical protein CHS0354_003119 [Potamilus streckersoni]
MYIAKFPLVSRGREPPSGLIRYSVIQCGFMKRNRLVPELLSSFYFSKSSRFCSKEDITAAAEEGRRTIFPKPP